MAKIKKAFFCQSCGFEAPKWYGKCPSCQSWNTMVEEIISSSNHIQSQQLEQITYQPFKPINIQDVGKVDFQRISALDSEFDNLLGGGIVPGSIMLLGGEPGIGKSTLLLQIALMLDKKILYVSGEESAEQIKLRALRIAQKNPNLYLYSETQTQEIFKQVKNLEPDLIIIDSIQTVYSDLVQSASGSIAQIRECAAEFQRLAKSTNIPIILIGHINKEGEIAGPKILEHIVDVVLQFEGDRNYTHRILRAIKNRFGAQHELAIYEMTEAGLHPVTNPSSLFLSDGQDIYSGTSVAASMEGARPFLIEIQALVSPTVYSVPQRTATGLDPRRLNMLLAVLDKRLGLQIANKDVFLNIAGGLKINDPALDLSVIASIVSSQFDHLIAPKFCFAAEVGLSGEIRAVHKIAQRIQEADKQGFEKIFVSRQNAIKELKTQQIQIIEVAKVSDMMKLLFK